MPYDQRHGFAMLAKNLQVNAPLRRARELRHMPLDASGNPLASSTILNRLNLADSHFFLMNTTTDVACR